MKALVRFNIQFLILIFLLLLKAQKKKRHVLSCYILAKVLPQQKEDLKIIA